ncbi:MAG: 4-demethylwyosine synthase TYW1 [Methanomassiliicoccales archaeon]|nr:4-demethylwyosine synthase TYW1 [Methanomassiliicoccales archaeon]NYT15833.1 4-demethylwyosine synthase TYW1 [Methanomassiliicoccales archaeon]
MNEGLKKILEKQQYRVYGDHAAVKLCHWMRQSLLHERSCYKQDFYGIRSHRCLQMTPVITKCNQRCLFCWRVQGFESEGGDWTDPEEMLDALIEHQRTLVSGFKGDARCPLEKFEEANEPKHVAISLAGEPTLYPRLGELLEVCHRRGLTTFLVTNGTLPEVLENLDPLPRQLYVTVAAPNEDIYRKLCVPLVPDGWERLNRTLEIMPSLNARTVIRHTLVKGWNLGWEEQYAILDEKAEPTFVEPKGFVLVGGSRSRLNLTNMPSHANIVEFSRRLGTLLGIEILKQKADSRVVLLGKSGTRTEIED